MTENWITPGDIVTLVTMRVLQFDDGGKPADAANFSVVPHGDHPGCMALLYLGTQSRDATERIDVEDRMRELGWVPRTHHLELIEAADSYRNAVKGYLLATDRHLKVMAKPLLFDGASVGAAKAGFHDAMEELERRESALLNAINRASGPMTIPPVVADGERKSNS